MNRNWQVLLSIFLLFTGSALSAIGYGSNNGNRSLNDLLFVGGVILSLTGAFWLLVLFIIMVLDER